jgi:hypothetical protein
MPLRGGPVTAFSYEPSRLHPKTPWGHAFRNECWFCGQGVRQGAVAAPHDPRSPGTRNGGRPHHHPASTTITLAIVVSWHAAHVPNPSGSRRATVRLTWLDRATTIHSHISGHAGRGDSHLGVTSSAFAAPRQDPTRSYRTRFWNGRSRFRHLTRQPLQLERGGVRAVAMNRYVHVITAVRWRCPQPFRGWVRSTSSSFPNASSDTAAEPLRVNCAATNFARKGLACSAQLA